MTPYSVSSGEIWQCPPWAIAPSAPIDTRTCRSCGARIAWLRTVHGFLEAVNQAGTSHFSDCRPKASREEAGL